MRSSESFPEESKHWIWIKLSFLFLHAPKILFIYLFYKYYTWTREEKDMFLHSAAGSWNYLSEKFPVGYILTTRWCSVTWKTDLPDRKIVLSLGIQMKEIKSTQISLWWSLTNFYSKKQNRHWKDLLFR